LNNKYVIFLIYLTIFVSSITLFQTPFEGYLSYIVYLLFFPIFIMRYGFPKLPFLIFLPLFIAGITYVQIGQNESGQFLKIFIGFFLAVVFYHYVIELFEGNVKKLFGYYMKGAFIVSVIGIIQVASYQIGFTPGYNYSWLLNKWSVTQGGFGIRMNSIFSEPSYFAAVIAPAFFVSLYNLSSNKKLFVDRKRSIVIAIAYLLTFSSLGIFGIYLAILLLLLNFGFFRYAVLFAPIFYYSFNYAYENIPEFRDRFDGTFDIFTTEDFRNTEIHGSSFVLYNNYHVALENFKRNPIFGTGLGSHPTAFEKYSLTKLEGVIDIDFNKQDANSMALRLMSETGLYGLVFMLVFIIKCWVFKQRAAETEIWVMSNALILIILLYLFRQGHYFLNGFPFFLWLFYYTWRYNKSIRSGEHAEESDETPALESNTVGS
jgi:O-antigen ligase